ncbi:MAG: hypothetical protein UH239_10580 [Acutalibacteraceae bacterium]|nr:hypothetical protein [Acutalibacteraceae bacterium]
MNQIATLETFLENPKIEFTNNLSGRMINCLQSAERIGYSAKHPTEMIHL